MHYTIECSSSAPAPVRSFSSAQDAITALLKTPSKFDPKMKKGKKSLIELQYLDGEPLAFIVVAEDDGIPLNFLLAIALREEEAQERLDILTDRANQRLGLAGHKPVVWEEEIFADD